MSEDSEQETMDLDASDTESDSGMSGNESKESAKTSEEIAQEKISAKYKALHGKRLFIRFPAKLPEDDAEFQTKACALSPLITAAHKPRQKHARFCILHFDSQSDRDEALKSIRSAKKTDEKFKGIVALIPRTESEGFVEELINKKIKSIEAKRIKARLKRAAKKAKAAAKKEFTSMILVRNLPSNMSMIEMKKLFPNAVDINLKRKGGAKGKSSIATVTLPTTMDARNAVKRELSVGGTALSIRFKAGNYVKKLTESNDELKPANTEDETETVVKKVKSENTKDEKKKLNKKVKSVNTEDETETVVKKVKSENTKDEKKKVNKKVKSANTKDGKKKGIKKVKSKKPKFKVTKI